MEASTRVKLRPATELDVPEYGLLYQGRTPGLEARQNSSSHKGGGAVVLNPCICQIGGTWHGGHWTNCLRPDTMGYEMQNSFWDCGDLRPPRSRRTHSIDHENHEERKNSPTSEVKDLNKTWKISGLFENQKNDYRKLDKCIRISKIVK